MPNSSFLAPEEHVLHDVEVVAEGEVLIDDLDAEAGRFAGAVDVDELPVEAHFAAVVGLHAGEALDESRLAGAVVADEGGDLSGVGLEVDTFEDIDGTEALDDSGQLDEWRVHSGSFRRDTAVPNSVCHRVRSAQ